MASYVFLPYCIEAIFVLSRYGTEATDLKYTGGSVTDYSNGNYLELSPTEKDVLTNLKALKDSGKISIEA